LASDVPVDPPGLRLGPLTNWLAQNVTGFDGSQPVQAALLPGGRSNITYRVTDASGLALAIRRPPLGHLLPSAHDMGREFRVMHGLGQVGFPVPPTHALCTDHEIIGSDFVVMGFVDGRVIASGEDSATLTPDECSTASRLLIDGLAALHRVDVEAAGLSALGRPSGYLQRQVRRWSDQWPLTKTQDLASIDALRDWLVAQLDSLPENAPTGLVHGDYRLDNVILSPGVDRLLAVLDWEMSTLGDPVADLAVALVYWSQRDDVLRNALPVARGVTTPEGFWTRAELLDRYASQTGFDLDHLDFCIVLACYKLAIIMESIQFRSLAGQQLGSAADSNEDMGAATRALADLGLQVIRLGGVAGLQA
jgi:aminoglycoside phosphotransferase (APT) family kinase protein